MMLRRMARHILAATPLPDIVLRCRAKNRLTVFGYHRIAPLPRRDYPFSDGVFSATPEELVRELRCIRSNLDVISMAELWDGLRNPALLPPRPAVITFDDGYRDNFTCAFPLLRDLGLSACFFVCTGLIGTRRVPWHEAWVCCLKHSRVTSIASPFCCGDPPYPLNAEDLPRSIARFRRHIRAMPWSRVPECLGRLRQATGVEPDEYLEEPLFMSWTELQGLADAGMEIGGHTRTHPILSRVDDAVLENEVGGCFRDLTEQLGRAPLAFAYPCGESDHMSDNADRAIEQAGFKLSFSFIHGFLPQREAGTRRLPRIHASYGDDHSAFRLRTATAPVR